jgi:hypothetical protein
LYGAIRLCTHCSCQYLDKSLVLGGRQAFLQFSQNVGEIAAQERWYG